MTAAELREQVLAVVRERGPVSMRQVRAKVPARAQRVDEALRALESDGQVRNTPHGWIAARNDGTRPGHGSAARQTLRQELIAAELAAMPRPERVRAIWRAMSPGARERTWSGLSDEQRVNAVAVLFDATSADKAP